jgi:hypothetical protein
MVTKTGKANAKSASDLYSYSHIYVSVERESRLLPGNNINCVDANIQ